MLPAIPPKEKSDGTWRVGTRLVETLQRQDNRIAITEIMTIWPNPLAIHESPIYGRPAPWTTVKKMIFSTLVDDISVLSAHQSGMLHHGHIQIDVTYVVSS
jgi:hypothetical protein